MAVSGTKFFPKKVKEGTGAFGYNATIGEYTGMIEAGILDPTVVARSALQNAASIAGLMITTEARVAEFPKEESRCRVVIWVQWAA